MSDSTTPVPLATKLFFGVGSVAEGVKTVVFNVFLLFYYNQVLGLSGTLGGLAIFLALCVDAITDPLVGSLSDSFHSRWGRRHPFMYSAALPMAVCFFFLFNPPSGLEQFGLFLWLTLFATGVRTAMTFYMVPSAALMPEITSHYDERTSLVSFRFLFGWLGALIAAQVGYLYYFAPSERFADGRLNPTAYASFALLCSLIIFVAILLSSAGTHRLIPTLRIPQDLTSFSSRRLLNEVRNILQNYSYFMLLIGGLFAATANGFQDVMQLYMATHFWGLSTKQITVLLYVYMTSTLIAFALARPLTQRYDKKKTVVALSTFTILVAPLPIFLRFLNLMPANGTPLLIGLLGLHLLIIIAMVIATQITLASMIADIVDEHEFLTGKRQEAMFFSSLSFTAKATSGIGGLLAGIALDIINFPKGAAQGTVPAETVFHLGLVVGPGLMLFYLFSLIFLARYRITRTYHQEVLTQLAQRQQTSREPQEVRAAVVS